MRIRKWFMKQQWRIVQIRTIWNLIYGIFILAGLYVGYIPILADMGIMGPFIFAGIVFFSFLIIGYIYDRVLVMWAPSQEVTYERNPYQYVPSPKDHIFWFPIYSTILDACEQLAEEFNMDTEDIKATKKHYAEIQKLRPERNEDIDRSVELRKEFVAKYKFNTEIAEEVDDE